MSVSREELYEQVWAAPMTKVAAKYGVSSSFMARVCDRLNVPRPPRGYWAKLAVGKTPAVPALPEARDELEWSRDGEPRRVRAALPKAPEKSPRKRRPRAQLPERHPLVASARQHFDSAKVADTGYLRPSKRLLVDVFVSKDAISRALDVMNTLFLALEAQGHQVVFAPRDQSYRRSAVNEVDWPGEYDHGRWWPARPTVVFVGTVAIGLMLFELTEEVEVRYMNGQYVRLSSLSGAARRGRAWSHGWTSKRRLPSGRFCLRAFSPYHTADWEKLWRESKPGGLSKMIGEIVRTLESEAATIARLVEEGERRAEIQHQRWEEQSGRACSPGEKGDEPESVA